MWPPKFHWVPTVEEAADRINLPHEDFPDRVIRTREMIEWVSSGLIPGSLGYTITQDLIRQIHSHIMSEFDWRGKYRAADVRVGAYRAPRAWKVPDLMAGTHPIVIANILDLQRWYLNFEEIHPFRDGNGRVGGVIISAISHALEPEKGYLVSGV